MASQGKVVSQIFPSFNGRTNAALFFQLIRERGYTRVSFPPGCLDGSLPIAESENVLLDEETKNRNIQNYAILYNEISRSLEGAALITKSLIDIADNKSGYLLLTRLKAAAGENAQIGGPNRLGKFLDLHMETEKYKILYHWLEFWESKIVELESSGEELTDRLKLVTLRKSLRVHDNRFGQYLTHTHTNEFDYEKTYNYFLSVAELLLEEDKSNTFKGNNNDETIMYSTARKTSRPSGQGQRPAAIPRPHERCFRCREEGHYGSNCPYNVTANKGILCPKCYPEGATSVNLPIRQKPHGAQQCRQVGGPMHDPSRRPGAPKRQNKRTCPLCTLRWCAKRINFLYRNRKTEHRQ